MPNSPPINLKDRYELIEELGRGGMSVVYRAIDKTLDREVAIKFLQISQNEQSHNSERFLREARTVARLTHNNIITLFDMGIEAEWHFHVLEYISGMNLREYTQQQGGVLSLHETLQIMQDVLEGLAYAHAQGVVHRDIKPENIMLTNDGHVKIADFGLALGKEDVRLTETDAIVGTVLYIAPEIAQGHDFDHRADLYAVGAMLYELITGKLPFSGNTSLDVLQNMLTTPLTSPRFHVPTLPEQVEHVILTLMARDPKERYPSAQATIDAFPDLSNQEALISEELKRATSERLSRTLLERIVRSSSVTHPKLDADDDENDLLVDADKPLAQDLLIYAAHEDMIGAVEAERKNMARLLQETVIDPINLLLAQAHAYEQTMQQNVQAKMAVSVLTSLARQVLQQTRDLESSLSPTLLETLGLEPALESLANQHMRSHGGRVLLSIPRMRERLPFQIELTLFRATQDSLDRAFRQANASQIVIQLQKSENEIQFEIADNGIPPVSDILRATRQRIEGLGGEMLLQSSQYGGLQVAIRFYLEVPIELTEREMEVIQFLGQGLTNKEIATMLYISPRTVKFHLDNIYSKLGVNSRTEAAIYALRRGWISQHPDSMDRG